MYELDIHVLGDGTASVTTGKIPDEMHQEADKLMFKFGDSQGGERTTEQLRAGHGHVHDHEQEHDHVHE